jgi:acyl-CoA dehydrogenase
VDLSVAAPLRDILQRVGRFVDTELVPREAALAGQGFYAVEPELGRLRDKVRGLGLWAPQVPRELGGMGLGLLEHARVSEILGRSLFGHYVFGCQAPDAGNIEVLERHGTPAQKQEYLLPLVRGEIRSCFAMTEPDSPGSNPTQIRCRARRDRDSYVIDGAKWFTTGADGAGFAIVMAVTDPAADAHARATMILVPTGTPGFHLVRNIPVMGEAGEGHWSHGELRFESCRVPQANRLGAEGSGFLIAQERLGPGRIHHCMRLIGLAELALELAIRRGTSRTAFGKRLVDLGGNRERIADARIAIDQARLLVLDAAWKLDVGGPLNALSEVSQIKVVVPNMAQAVIDFAIQVHGGGGMSDDFPLAMAFVNARTLRLADGPDEVHRGMVARLELGKYA